MPLATVRAQRHAWQLQTETKFFFRQLQHALAQARQTLFQRPAERLQIQQPLFPSFLGESFYQQALASGKRFPMQAPLAIAGLIGTQSLETVAAFGLQLVALTSLASAPPAR